MVGRTFYGVKFFGVKIIVGILGGWEFCGKKYLGQNFGSPNFKVRFGRGRWNGRWLIPKKLELGVGG